jgi:hypothetical protein
MASIKDVEVSVGPMVTPLKNDDIVGGDDFNAVANDFVIFKMKGNQKRGVYIDGQDDVLNPKTGRTERIRLLTGVSTIWMSEQKDLDKEYVRNNRRSLEFRGRVCRINKLDTAALEFARICNSNVEAKNRVKVPRFEFFEYDPIKQAEASLKKEMLELDMAIKAKEMDSEMSKKFASFIGLNLINELGQAKPETAIKQEIMLYAKRNPQIFEKMLNSQQEIEIHWQIKSALLNNFIDISKTPGAVYWGSGGLISKIPSGTNAVKYLTDLALTNTEEGKAFLTKLKTLTK